MDNLVGNTLEHCMQSAAQAIVQGQDVLWIIFFICCGLMAINIVLEHITPYS